MDGTLVGESGCSPVSRSGLPGEAEVEQLHRAVGREEDVLGLQVAVGDLLVVRGGQAASNLRGDIDGLPRRQGAAGEPRAQRLAFEQLRHRVRRAIAVADVVNRQDVRMRERGHRAGLALEARERVRVGGHGRRHDLDGDVAFEPRVARPVDLAHAAGADGGQNLVRTETGTGSKRRQLMRESYTTTRGPMRAATISSVYRRLGKG